MSPERITSSSFFSSAVVLFRRKVSPQNDSLGTRIGNRPLLRCPPSAGGALDLLLFAATKYLTTDRAEGRSKLSRNSKTLFSDATKDACLFRPNLRRCFQHNG